MTRRSQRPTSRRRSLATVALVMATLTAVAARAHAQTTGAAAVSAAPPPQAGQASGGVGQAQEGAVALARGNPKEAVELYDAALQDTTLSGDRRASILTDRGVAHARLSQHKLAIEDFNRAVQLAPESAPIYNNRANVLLALGFAKEALRDLDRAILLAPGYAAAYNNRAQTYMRLGQTEQAVPDFTRAIELMPANAAPLNGRGRAQLALGRPFAAMRDLTRAIAIEPRFGPAYRGRAEAKLAVEAYDDAIADLSRASAFDPTSTEILSLRGHAYLGAKRPDAAIKDFTRIVELGTRSASVLAARGLAHAAAEAHEEALADLAQALEADPRSALAFAYRAWTYKQMGQPEPGFKDAERALRLDPKLGEAHWAQGELLEAGDKMDEAIAALQRAVGLKPGLAVAVEALQRLGASTGLEEQVAGELGLGAWSVIVSGKRYFARNIELPRLKVPLEPIGEHAPRITGWQTKEAPHKGIGVLRFHAGKVAGKGGQEDVELAAVIDIPSAAVLAIEPYRQGERMATWIWEEERLVVASLDAGTDELGLKALRGRDAKSKETPPAAPPRRVADAPPAGGSGQKSSNPAWAPWNQSPGGSGGFGGSGGQKSSGRKPKTLFDMLFGN